jgi:ribosomal protein L37AE/L43A
MKLTNKDYEEEPFCPACGSTDIMFCMKTSTYKCLSCGATVELEPDVQPNKQRYRTRNKNKDVDKVQKMRDWDNEFSHD